MKTLDALLERVERWVIFVCFATSLVALTYGVLTRYAVRRPFAWPAGWCAGSRGGWR
ncbi:MAG: hypothetical protein ACNA8S_04800 [Deferrisomatales bacterium]